MLVSQLLFLPDDSQPAPAVTSNRLSSAGHTELAADHRGVGGSSGNVASGPVVLLIQFG